MDAQDTNQNVDAALTRLRSDISRVALSNELQTRSVKIVNADGRTLISLSAGSAGGYIAISNPTSGKHVVYLGPVSVTGDGGLWLSDKSGRVMLHGIAAGTGGHLGLYSFGSGTQKVIAYLGLAPDTGDVGFWLYDKNGKLMQR